MTQDEANDLFFSLSRAVDDASVALTSAMTVEFLKEDKKKEKYESTSSHLAPSGEI